MQSRLASIILVVELDKVAQLREIEREGERVRVVYVPVSRSTTVTTETTKLE